MDCDLTQFLSNPLLENFIVKKGLALDTSRGLAYLHSKNIIHNDVKSYNVLIKVNSDKCKAKIADFGISSFINESSETDDCTIKGGSYSWQAPEVIENLSLVSQKSDVYSYGIILWQIVTCKLPYNNIEKKDILKRKKEYMIQEIPYSTPRYISFLIETCQKTIPKYRPSMDDIVRILEDREYVSFCADNINHSTTLYDLNIKMSTKYFDDQTQLDQRYLVDTLKALLQDIELDYNKQKIIQLLNLRNNCSVDMIYYHAGKLFFSLSQSTDEHYSTLALKCFKKSFEYRENRLVAYMIGLCYRLGLGVDSNFEKSYEYFSKSYSSKNIASVIAIVECCIFGLGTPKNFDKAYRLLSSLEDKNNSKIYFYKAMLYSSSYKSDWPNAIYFYNKANELSHLESKYRLSVIHLNQKGVKSNADLNKAITYLNECYKKGHIKATTQLAICYYYGIGVSKDIEKAFSMFSENSTCKISRFYLSLFYSKGEVVDKNYKIALSLADVSAVSGHDECLYHTCLLNLIVNNRVENIESLKFFKLNGSWLSIITYFKYKILTRDKNMDMFLLKALTNNSMSLDETHLLVGYCLCKGIHDKPDMQLGLNHLRISAQMGNNNAKRYFNYFSINSKPSLSTKQIVFGFYKELSNTCENSKNDLGVCYFKGYGTERDFSKAYSIFQSLEYSKNLTAITNLAKCYFYKIGTLINLQKAYSLFKRANNNPIATYYLNKYYNSNMSMSNKTLL